jgi:RAB protein geranylgeranyltransferase component A
VDLKNSSDVGYWRKQPASERFRAIQINRQCAYGRTITSARLQRILEIVDEIDDITLNIISKKHLCINKRASARHKDIDDLQHLLDE